MRTTSFAVFLSLVAVTTLAVSACSYDRQTIRIDGSSTVFPISEAAAEEYSKLNRARINVGFSGTGAGFEKFCRGDTHISDASRPIKDSEINSCAENGIDDIVELQVAIDALTVVVNPDNEFLECLTVQQLHDLFSGKATKWSDLDPSWPDQNASFFYPGTDSGTFDYFVEAIIEDIDEEAFHTADGTPSEDDNVLGLGIRNEENAIGYFGFAYFLEAAQSLKAVAIDDGDGCVDPTFENALDGTYTPLSRPLFIYTRESFLAEHPENPVLSFVQFYLNSTDALVQEVGYVTVPAETLASQLEKVERFLPDDLEEVTE
jgi:phosphate transport system substrate-binding protein